MDETIESAISQRSDAVMELPGVQGLGQGLCDGTPCIRVFVAKAAPEVIRQIRQLLRGHPVDIEETGEFQPLTS